MNRLIKSLILISMGLFLYTRLTGEVILFYINQRFVTLTLLAAVGLVLVGATYFWRRDSAGTHNHGHLSLVGLLLLAMPMILGWLVPPQPLGAAALGNREINLGNLAPIAAPRENAEMGLLSGERNILDWLYDFQQTDDPEAFNGQEAHVVGFVYRDDRFASETFMVGRYIVSCCVADANPIGLIARWPDAPTLAEDQWVEVSGHFEVGDFDGSSMPILIVDNITLIDPPSQPYLYQ